MPLFMPRNSSKAREERMRALTVEMTIYRRRWMQAATDCFLPRLRISSIDCCNGRALPPDQRHLARPASLQPSHPYPNIPILGRSGSGVRRLMRSLFLSRAGRVLDPSRSSNDLFKRNFKSSKDLLFRERPGFLGDCSLRSTVDRM